MSKYLEGKDFVTGTQLTFVDFILYELLELIDFIWQPDAFGKYPTLKAYHDRVHNLPKLKTLKDAEPFLPFNNTQAHVGGSRHKHK